MMGGGQTLKKSLHTDAAATANGEEMNALSQNVGSYLTFTVQISGISGDTITFECTLDGTNWVAFQMEDVSSGTAATTATADGVYRGTVVGFVKVRTRISTYSAGTINVTGVLST